MPRKKKDILTRSTGVTLELPVLDYLDNLVTGGTAKDRSAVLNIVVREHAKRKGHPLPSAKILSEQPQLDLKR